MKLLVTMIATFLTTQAFALPVTKVLIQGRSTVRLMNADGTPNTGSRYTPFPGSKEVADQLHQNRASEAEICEVEMVTPQLLHESIAIIYSIDRCTAYQFPK
ncbi:hypothetical protein AZI86_12230 [Bdellovibrio bacteriovorus]|uniref:Uncharacterized protein n=1 Tax=Bdellovibrio bacteriovorus TaxID=959 RepID=A0A150WM26_BDEBC|nr:hypothetical protein [Bdellovibrio bacteriovorus]KYG64956.1 hypothetical protein AZI86_12230 [Bdellovibrio bacteriovorus]